MNVEYESLIKDKKIALVGPAAYMMGSKLGKEIDCFDLVVRINRSYEVTEDFRHDIGSRTDILYSCMIEKSENAGKVNLNTLKKLDLKYLCIPPASNMKGLANTASLHEMINKSNFEQIREKIPTRIVDHFFHNDLAKNIDCRPNTGFMAIYDILRFNPDALKIYGFSFYLDGFMEGVKEGVQQEVGKTPNELAQKCFKSTRHVQKNMWIHAKNTLLNNEKVSLDRVLKYILNMTTFDKDNFKTPEYV